MHFDVNEVNRQPRPCVARPTPLIVLRNPTRQIRCPSGVKTAISALQDVAITGHLYLGFLPARKPNMRAKTSPLPGISVAGCPSQSPAWRCFSHASRP